MGVKSVQVHVCVALMPSYYVITVSLVLHTELFARHYSLRHFVCVSSCMNH